MFNIRNILGLLSESPRRLDRLEKETTPSSSSSPSFLSSTSSSSSPLDNFNYTSVIRFRSRYVRTSDAQELKRIKTKCRDCLDPLFDESPFAGREFGNVQRNLERSRKKLRTSFTKHQLERLEASFGRHKYLTVKDRAFLSSSLKLSDVQIKTWYQNRRTKWKRESGRRGSQFSSWFADNAGVPEARNDEQPGGPWVESSKPDSPDQAESNLFDAEESFFRSVTTPESYEVIRRWHFNAFMCAFANPHFECR